MASLDADQLVERARSFARSDDFLGTGWRPNLEALTEALSTGPGASPQRLQRVGLELVSALVTRARMAALLRARPQIREVESPPPVVIVGLPRTGTTLLHNLLSQVPGNRGYRLWELRAPAFPVGAPLDQARREREATEAVLTEIYARAAGFEAIHVMRADRPDECNWLMRHSFSTPIYAFAHPVPGYYQTLMAGDRRPAYEEWWLQIQMLRWRSPGGVPILKDPGHLWSLRALLAVRPDARIVLTERSLEACIPSLASLCAALQSVDGQRRAPEVVGAEALAMAADGLAELAAARAARPEAFIPVEFDALVADPLGMVEGIQAALGRPLDDVGRRRCARFLKDQRAERRNSHRYSLEHFGIPPEALSALCARA